jgi:predicted nucleic acid-binding protein
VKLFSIDSSILICAEGVSGRVRRDIAVSTIYSIGHERILLSTQTSGETARWLVKKGGLNRTEAVQRITWWMDQCIPIPVSNEAFRTALSLVEKHAFQLWDAVVLAASAEAGADVSLSEDMQHGFVWSGVTILNPFILSPEQRMALAAGRALH